MSNKPSIGVVGSGTIGSAISEAFSHYTNVKVYDINKRLDDYVNVINQDILFLAVPTPMLKDGSTDLSIIDSALEKLANNVIPNRVKPVIIKSTIPPAQLGQLMLKYGENLLIIFSPEFLTERTSYHDYIQSNRFIFGTLHEFDKTPEAKLVSDLFELRFPSVPQYWTTFAEASLIKYAANTFFTIKLSFMNELKQLATAWNVNYESLIGKVMLDPRIGRSHFNVPGHDGKFGWAGVCFTKDIHSFIDIANECGVDPIMAKAAWKKNVEVRGLSNLTEEINKNIGRISSESFSLDDVAGLG